MAAMLECPYCRASQLQELEGEQPCGACGRAFFFVRFHPAPLRPAAVEGAVGRTPCFQHSCNLSASACQRCGSFLCGLCETRAEGRIFCPACFGRLHAEGWLASTRRELVAWGRLVMLLGILGLVPFYGCGFGAVALGVGVYGLSRMKKAHAPGGKGWVLAGMAIGLAGMVLWSVLFGKILRDVWPARGLVTVPSTPSSAGRSR